MWTNILKRLILLLIFLFGINGGKAAIYNYQQQKQQQQNRYPQQQHSPQQQQQQQPHPFHNLGAPFSTATPSTPYKHTTVTNPPPTPTSQTIQTNQNTLLDRYNHHYPDGSYEFRYELADGTARYERGYFLLIDKIKTLVVVGYYSYRMPDGRYITVFYNADQNGYRQNHSITERTYPNLPRSIEVPEFKQANNNINAIDDAYDDDNNDDTEDNKINVDFGKSTALPTLTKRHYSSSTATTTAATTALTTKSLNSATKRRGGHF